MRLRRPSVRARLAVASALAVAVAIAAVSAVAWVATARTLLGQVDQTLDPLPRARPDTGPPGGPAAPGQGTGPVAPGQEAGPVLPGAEAGPMVLGPEDREAVCERLEGGAAALGRALTGVQLVFADGTTCGSDQLGTVRATAQDLAVAREPGALAEPTPARDDETSLGVPVRVRAYSLGDGVAVLLLRDVSDVEDTLRRLGVLLAGVTALGSLVALGAGWLVARTGLRPLDDLTGAAEHIAATEDLDVPISVSGTDEIARLGTAFNHMTAALSASRARQQQLVADASHELRTPLTSLRTNVELLARADAAGREIPRSQRRDLLDSLVAQTVELGDLVSELTVLAHHEQVPERVDVDLVEVVRRAVRRAARRGDHEITVDAAPWWVVGDPVALERAVLNVLDNAVKFSPPATRVDVTLREGVLDVDDAGPGIPPGERARVFDRFWRSAAARAMPGSGLGLAIVADTVAAHGGSVDVLDSPRGGARVRVHLPGSGGPH